MQLTGRECCEFAQSHYPPRQRTPWKCLKAEKRAGWQKVAREVQCILNEPIPMRGYLGLFGIEMEPIMARLVQLERQ